MPESADLPPPSIKDVIAAGRRPRRRSAATACRRRDRNACASAVEPQRHRRAAPPRPPHSVPDSAKDAPTFTTAAADTAVVDKLRDQLAAGKFDRILGGKKERATVEPFYAEPQLRAALDRRRRDERARQGRGGLSGRRRCRWPRSERISGAADQGRHGAGRARRSRDQVHRLRADLRAPRHERPRALQPRLRRHRLRPRQARSGQRAGARRQGTGRRPRRSTASIRRSRSTRR